MSDIVIRVDDLSKQFTIGGAQPKYRTLRDQVVAGLGSLFQRNGRRGSHRATIWALKNVSFEVRQGEVLGIVGRNGSGKSTLLKILSRITEPTTGSASIRGKVGSLLEVGTGFHPELTGRENIYLNAAILGLRRSQINRKFDDIVEFAGVEKFLDTPVKHYSSGMHVRLAFAVAAHLDPEILIIDEVLAVGDASFQARCLGKMEEVARGGRTVLFVSHNLGAIANLCTTALWLDEGEVRARGEVATTVTSYIKSNTAVSQADTKHWRRHGTGEARITNVRLLDSAGDPCTTFSMGETLVVEFDAEFYRGFPSVNLSLEVKRTDMGIHVLHLESQDCGCRLEKIPEGKRSFRVQIPNCLLYPSHYQISLSIWGAGTFDKVLDVLSFSVVQSDITKRTYPLSRHTQAVFYAPSVWEDLTIAGSTRA